MDPIVGGFFKAWDRQLYYCMSQDKNGLWMVNVRIPHERKNVSERVIGRTFHQVWNFGLDVQVYGHPFTLWGRISNEDIDAISSFKAKLDDLLPSI